MEAFESYVKSNWNVPNATSCGITYTHSTRTTTNKQHVSTKNHTVTLTINWRDKDNNQLKTEKLAFLNDDMTKTYDKKLYTINRNELVNKFRAAKPQIIYKLISDKQTKLMSLQQDIAELHEYIGRSDDIIPQSMKGTIDIVQTQVQATAKPSFDM